MVILFGAAYALGPFYELVPPLVGFALMAAASLVGLLVALRLGQLVAAIGIVGAFVTPALVQTTNASLPGLFAYLLFVAVTSLAVVRYAAWVWLGWATTVAGAGWIVVAILSGQHDALWAPALFGPVLAALQAGSVAAYDARMTLLASVVGAVVIAVVEPGPGAHRVTRVAAALLLSSLTVVMTLTIGSDEPNVTLLAVGLVPFGLGMVVALLPVAPGRTRQAMLALPAFVTTTAAIIWLAFGTNYGHFWLNAGRLEALAASLAATPAITSLALGTDDRGEGGYQFDSYRLVNDVLVTHYPDQARPDQQQPTIDVDDELRALGVPRERYDAMRRLMTRSTIGFIAHDRANGQVSMNRVGFDNEWDPFLVYMPDGGSPGRDLAILGSPRPHWFWVSHR